MAHVPANQATEPYTDDRVGFELRLTTTAESEAFTADPGGAFVIDHQSDDEISGSFDASFGDDELVGCFTFFPTTRITLVVEDGSE